MALRFLFRTPWRDLAPVIRCQRTLHMLPQGGSSNGAKADVGRKTTEKVDHLLAKLEKEGVERDDKIASIIDDGIARIKAEDATEAARENINELKRNGMAVLLTIASVAVGFIMGAKWYEHAFRAANAKRRRALDEELAKRRRA